jgi:hypothetical protein
LQNSSGLHFCHNEGRWRYTKVRMSSFAQRMFSNPMKVIEHFELNIVKFNPKNQPISLDL